MSYNHRQKFLNLNGNFLCVKVSWHYDCKIFSKSAAHPSFAAQLEKTCCLVRKFLPPSVAVKILVLKSMFASFGRLEYCQNISQSALQLLQITVSVSVISISDFSKVQRIFYWIQIQKYSFSLVCSVIQYSVIQFLGKAFLSSVSSVDS